MRTGQATAGTTYTVTYTRDGETITKHIQTTLGAYDAVARATGEKPTFCVCEGRGRDRRPNFWTSQTDSFRAIQVSR